MKDALVTCKMPDLRLPDLNLKLIQGQTVWLTPKQVQLSKDLQHAKQIGAVGITWKERARVTKPPAPPPQAPPHFRRLTPGQHRKIERDPPPPAPVVVHNIHPDQIAKTVKAAVAGEVSKQMQEIKEQVEALKGDLAEQVAEAMAAQGQQIDQETLAATMKGVLDKALAEVQMASPGVSEAQGAAPVSSDEDAPVYIPKGMVDHEVKGKVDVKESTSDARGADEALKALRKRRKQK